MTSKPTSKRQPCQYAAHLPKDEAHVIAAAVAAIINVYIATAAVARGGDVLLVVMMQPVIVAHIFAHACVCMYLCIYKGLL